MKLGTTFALWVAKPIARGIDGVLGTDIEHCRGCQDRPYFSQRALNNLGDTVTNWLTNKGDKMPDENEEIEYLLQVSVKAVDLKDASSKVTGGKIISGGPMPKAMTGQIRAMPMGGQPGQMTTQGRATSQSGT